MAATLPVESDRDLQEAQHLLFVIRVSPKKEAVEK